MLETPTIKRAEGLLRALVVAAVGTLGAVAVASHPAAGDVQLIAALIGLRTAVVPATGWGLPDDLQESDSRALSAGTGVVLVSGRVAGVATAGLAAALGRHDLSRAIGAIGAIGQAIARR